MGLEVILEVLLLQVDHHVHTPASPDLIPVLDHRQYPAQHLPDTDHQLGGRGGEPAPAPGPGNW